MGAFLGDISDTRLPYPDNRPFGRWELKRAYGFHRCIDTGTIIWPFTKAYYNRSLRVSSRVTITERGVAKWITPEAYTFRSLRRVED